MANDKFEIQGIVKKTLKGGKFEVELENKHIVTCTVSGKLTLNKIRILPDDVVTVAIGHYDLTKGIIVWRGKK